MKNSIFRPLWLLACCAAAGVLPLPLCSGNQLMDFARLRAGPTVGRGHVWYYRGVISDPTSGKRLVSIEGLERTELATCSADSASYWSRKVFLYSDGGTRPRPSLLNLLWGGNSSQTTEVWARPKVFEELITLGADPTGGLFSRIKLTGQRLIPRTKIDVAPPPPSAGCTPHLLDISHRVASDNSPLRRTQPGWALSSWLSVMSPLSRDVPPGRTQEQYSLVHAESRLGRVKNSMYAFLGIPAAPDVVLRYWRHGEGAPWIGARGVCLTELTAWRYGDDRRSLPRGTLTRLEKQLPGFVANVLRRGKGKLDE